MNRGHFPTVRGDTLSLATTLLSRPRAQLSTIADRNGTLRRFATPTIAARISRSTSVSSSTAFGRPLSRISDSNTIRYAPNFWYRTLAAGDEDLSLSWQVATPEAAIYGLGPFNLQSRGRFENGQWYSEDSQAEGHGGRLRVVGSGEGLAVTAEDLSAQSLLANFLDEPPPISARIAGQMDVNPEDWLGEGHVTLQPGAGPGVPLEGDARLRLDEDEVVVASDRLRVGGVVTRVEARFGFDQSLDAQARGVARPEQLVALANRLGVHLPQLPVEGALGFDVNVGGSFAKPEIGARVRAPHLEVLGSTAALTATLELTADGALRVDSRLESGDGQARLEGTMPLGSSTGSWDLTLEATDFEVARLGDESSLLPVRVDAIARLRDSDGGARVALESFQARLADGVVDATGVYVVSTGAVSLRISGRDLDLAMLPGVDAGSIGGRAAFDATLEGPVADLAGSGRLHLDHLRYGEIQLGELVLDAELADGTVRLATPLRGLPLTELALSRPRLEGTDTELTARGEFPLAPLGPIVGLDSLAGTLSLDVRLGGTHEAPIPEGRVTLTHGAGAQGASRWSGVELDAEIDGGLLSVERFTGQALQGQFDVRGTWPIDEQSVERTDGLDFSLRDLELAPLFSAGGDAASLRVALHGRLEGGLALSSLRGDVRIDAVDATWNERRVRLDTPADLSIREGRLQPATLSFETEGASLSVDVEGGAAGEALDWRVAARGELDLAVLTHEMVEDAILEGTVRLDASIGSDESTPLTVSASIDRAALQWLDPPLHVTDIEGVIQLDGDVVRVSGLQGRIGAGSLEIEGEVPLGSPQPTTPLSIRMQRLPLTLGTGVRGRVSGELQLSIVEADPRLTGSLQVTDTLYTREVDTSSRSLDGLER